MPPQVPRQVRERLVLPPAGIEPDFMISDERTQGIRQDPPPPGQVPELPDLQPQFRHCRPPVRASSSGTAAGSDCRRHARRGRCRDLRRQYRHVGRAARGDEEQDRPGDDEQPAAQRAPARPLQVRLDLPDVRQGQQPPDICAHPRCVIVHAAELALKHGAAPGILLGRRLPGQVGRDFPVVVLALEKACHAGGGQAEELLGLRFDALPQASAEDSSFPQYGIAAHPKSSMPNERGFLVAATHPGAAASILACTMRSRRA